MRKVNLRKASDTDLQALIDDALVDLAGDELRVALRILWRLGDGRQEYGQLDLENDPRDFEEELALEYDDIPVYRGFLQEKEML